MHMVGRQDGRRRFRVYWALVVVLLITGICVATFAQETAAEGNGPVLILRDGTVIDLASPGDDWPPSVALRDGVLFIDEDDVAIMGDYDGPVTFGESVKTVYMANASVTGPVTFEGLTPTLYIGGEVFIGHGGNTADKPGPYAINAGENLTIEQMDGGRMAELTGNSEQDTPAILTIDGVVLVENRLNIEPGIETTITGDGKTPGSTVIVKNECLICEMERGTNASAHGLRRCGLHYSCMPGGGTAEHRTKCGECTQYLCACICVDEVIEEPEDNRRDDDDVTEKPKESGCACDSKCDFCSDYGCLDGGYPCTCGPMPDETEPPLVS